MARRGGCLINGCLGVLLLGVALAALVGVGTYVDFQRDVGKARDQVEAGAERAEVELTGAAEDGTLLGTEISRAVRGGEVRRQGREVTVTGSFIGRVNGWYVGGISAIDCYRFRIVPPAAAVREVVEEGCGYALKATRRDPAAVADDVVVELRSAVARGGVTAASTAQVWQTPGITVEDTETEGGRLTRLAWLVGGTGQQGKGCYEFRAAKSSVTAKRLKPEGCYGRIG
ncbi:hypothetical protein [Streptomyces phaeochromogenes]|uniref:hypothetical protein n=1 Tax=Streptomyces phaeochromogenes TaxID=1923 RepID=UPI002DD8F058|nr:hypothetical protein [Streptomyces phaeochromogenes]WRZ27936.1 hypothetical protein OG931_09365 [Streptomyces phaeochromogenes]